MNDEQFMRRAMDLARRAGEEGEVPIGAVVALGGDIVGEGWNRPIAAVDPTAHAEIQAMRAAAKKLGNYRLTGAELYVTLEPCDMCVGAMFHARTPRGRHIVRAKIGAGQPLGAVFVRRRPSGEVWTPELHAKYPGRDWILTRILWLSGCEPGRNRLGDVDTMRRYIYIHGTPDTSELGKPGSIGCIRMRNKDVAELFDLVPAYTEVEITDGPR